MDKNFDLGKIGKRMPYRVPDGFFDRLEANVRTELAHKAEDRPKALVVSLRRIVGLAAVAASVALVLVLRPFDNHEPAAGMQQVEQAFSQLSPEDQDYLLEVYQEDVFLNE